MGGAQKLGSKKKTWAELVAPAIKLAEEGFVVDAYAATVIKEDAERLVKYPASAVLYLPGRAAREGRSPQEPGARPLLRRVAEKGPEGFYKGATAGLDWRR